MVIKIIVLIVFIVAILFFAYVIKTYFKTPTVEFEENHNGLIGGFESLEEDFKDLERTYGGMMENLKDDINKQ